MFSLLFFQRYWKLGLFALCAVFLVGLYMRLHYVSMQRDLAQTKLAALGNQIQQQNEAIMEWKKQEVLQTERLQGAMAAAQRERENYRQEVDKVMTEKVPTECNAAINWAAQMAKELIR